ncbi:MAG: hypothetical protein HKN74_07155 [Acidimicrobiia bacterium]|nr:hypothetical protein [Acidimicrobiia bacterium]
MDLEGIDRFGGKVVARFWGTVLLLAVVLIGGSAVVFAMATGRWAMAIIALVLAVPGLLVVRYLYSPKRRLTDFE